MMQYIVTTNAGVDVTAQWTGRTIEISACPAGSLLIEWASTQDRAIKIFNRFIDKYTNKEQVSMDTNEPVAGVTVAVEEPLSEVARIRLELAALFDAHKSFTGAYRNAAWQEAQKKRYLLARDVFYEDVDMKMKTLFDTIDQQARELEAVKKLTRACVDASVTKPETIDLKKRIEGGLWAGLALASGDDHRQDSSNILKIRDGIEAWGEYNS